MVRYSASSVSSKRAVGGTIKLILAPGATACDHSTSRLISASGPAQELGPGMFRILKFEGVSAGNPNCAEKALASAVMVGEPHQSMMAMVCPAPAKPSLYRPVRL